MFDDWFSPAMLGTWITIAVVIGLVILLIMVLFLIGRFVSQTALVRMVDQYERSGEKLTWKQGFRLGWSKAAWRLFLVNLTIYLPIYLVLFLLIGCASLPVLLSMLGGRHPSMPGIIAGIGMAFLIVFLAIIVHVALTLVMEIIARTCILDDRRVRDSIRTGWQLVRGQFKDVFLMWLVLIGVRIGYFVVIIPVALLFVGVGLLFGGGIGLAAYALVNALSGSVPGILAAAIAGGLVFMIILSVPLLFLGGLLETFISSTWTLTYRELGTGGLEMENLPEVKAA
jgi:hypothetical protein